MSEQIDKTIKRVREAFELQLAETKFGVERGKIAKGHFDRTAANSIMPIITAYEESQKELEFMKKAICGAVNSHDTYLADIGRLLDRLRPLSEAYLEAEKVWAEVNYIPKDEDRLVTSSQITVGQARLAHQTYTELREKYPKEEKDGKQKND